MADKSTGPKGPDPKSPGPSDEMKAKFREALAKKNAHGGKDLGDRSGHSKVDHAHGAETSAREQMFRRKSG